MCVLASLHLYYFIVKYVLLLYIYSLLTARERKYSTYSALPIQYPHNFLLIDEYCMNSRKNAERGSAATGIWLHCDREQKFFPRSTDGVREEAGWKGRKMLKERVREGWKGQGKGNEGT